MNKVLLQQWSSVVATKVLNDIWTVSDEQAGEIANAIVIAVEHYAESSLLKRALMGEIESASGMGAAGLAVGAGDGQDNVFSNGKAGPAEVPASAGNVPAAGHRCICRPVGCGDGETRVVDPRCKAHT